MREPLTLTVNLVTGILDMISGVKTNYNDCEELGKTTQHFEQASKACLN